MERITQNTPPEIKELFRFPYEFFSQKYGSKKRTVLDAGCGEAINYDLLSKKFKIVYLADKEKSREDVIQCSLENLPLISKTIDITFCFEVVEHFPKENQDKLLEELARVTEDYLIIGSINKDGPDFYKGVEIFKAKTNTNPYHLNELNVEDFTALNNRLLPLESVIDYFHSEIEDGQLVMKEGLSANGFCNYAVNIL